MDEIISETLNQTPQVIEKISGLLPKDFPKEISEPVLSALEKRAKILD